MNKGVSPIGTNLGFRSAHIKPNKAIDAAYAHELSTIKKQRIATDIFEKVSPESKMQKVINKIQITIDSIKGASV